MSAKSTASACITALLLIAFNSTNSNAAEPNHNLQIKTSFNDTQTYLENFEKNSKITSENFSRIVVQSGGGRMKPLNTLNNEIVTKLTGKSSMFGMNSDQIILGMLSRPEVWRNVKMIKIKTPKLKKSFRN